MPTPHGYAAIQPTRADVDALPGAVLLDFGTDWCGYCRAGQRLIEQALVDHPPIRHLKVEDGRGRPLGRSFGVKLWPTMIALLDGREVGRLVRPTSRRAIAEVLDLLSTGTPGPS